MFQCITVIILILTIYFLISSRVKNPCFRLIFYKVLYLTNILTLGSNTIKNLQEKIISILIEFNMYTLLTIYKQSNE